MVRRVLTSVLLVLVPALSVPIAIAPAAAASGAAPSITINPQDADVTYGGTATFLAAATGTPTPTVDWQLSVDGGVTWMSVGPLTGDSVTTGPLTLFENGWEVRAVFSNQSGSATTDVATIEVNVPAPTTFIGIPADGATVFGSAWLDAVAQSPVGIASVSYIVNGGSEVNFVVSSATDTTYGWIGAWDTTDVPNGTYTLSSVATDTLGTSTTSAGVSVTVDNLPLHTEVLVPSDGATLSGSAVLDASAAGTSDVTGVQFVVTGGALTDRLVGTATITVAGWIAYWDTTGVANGTYTLQSVATETGGTTAKSSGTSVTVNNPITLADLANSLVGGTAGFIFCKTFTGCNNCLGLQGGFSTTYSGSANVGSVALDVNGCWQPPFPAPVFTITTNVGGLSGSASGGIGDITLTVSTGSGAFAAATGTLHLITLNYQGQATFVGSVTVP